MLGQGINLNCRSPDICSDAPRKRGASLIGYFVDNIGAVEHRTVGPVPPVQQL